MYEIYKSLPFIFICALIFAFWRYLSLPVEGKNKETNENKNEKDNNIKRSKKVFLLSFFGFFVVLVIVMHFFPPHHTWEKIYKDLHQYIIFSLMFAMIMYFALPVKVKYKENNFKNKESFKKFSIIMVVMITIIISSGCNRFGRGKGFLELNGKMYPLYECMVRKKVNEHKVDIDYFFYLRGYNYSTFASCFSICHFKEFEI